MKLWITALYGLSLKTYVRMSGSYERASAKKVYENETGKLKERITELEEELTNFKVNMNKIKVAIIKEIVEDLKEKSQFNNL